MHVFGSAFGFGFGAYVKALIGFKAFYFFGSVSVRFRCICEMAFSTKVKTFIFSLGGGGGGGRGSGGFPQKPKIKKKRNEGFSFKVRFFLHFCRAPLIPKTMSLLRKSLKIITSAPQLPENK